MLFIVWQRMCSRFYWGGDCTSFSFLCLLCYCDVGVCVAEWRMVWTNSTVWKSWSSHPKLCRLASLPKAFWATLKRFRNSSAVEDRGSDKLHRIDYLSSSYFTDQIKTMRTWGREAGDVGSSSICGELVQERRVVPLFRGTMGLFLMCCLDGSWMRVAPFCIMDSANHWETYKLTSLTH